VLFRSLEKDAAGGGLTGEVEESRQSGSDRDAYRTGKEDESEEGDYRDPGGLRE